MVFDPGSFRLTTKRFTGQYHEASIPGGEGLYYYNARWYDAKLGRFVSPDTLVLSPSNPQSLNRYAYVYNNPLRYTDLSGHSVDDCDPTQYCPGGSPGSSSGNSGGGKDNDSAYQQMLFWHGVSTYFYGYLITKPRVSPPPASNNMTGWLSLQLYSLARSDMIATMKYMHDDSIWGFVAATDLWAASVGTGGIWDFKKDILDAGIQDTNGNIVIGNQTLNFQSVANITFGFAGSEVGFSPTFLHLGAGIAQAEHGFEHWSGNMRNAPQYFGDQAFDGWAVDFGIYLHRLYVQNPTALMPSNLTQALDTFISTGHPIPTGP